MSSRLDNQRFDLMVKLRTLAGLMAAESDERKRKRLEGDMSRTIDQVDDLIKRALSEES